MTTTRGRQGHAIYGPYEFRDPGSYAVEFRLALAETGGSLLNPLCAVVDVACDAGTNILVRREIRLADLRDGEASFILPFTITERSKLEYRVWSSGASALKLDEHRRVRRLDLLAPGSPVAMLADFPGPNDPAPAFFRTYEAHFRHFYDRGFGIGFADDAVVLEHEGISFFASSNDDFNFIGEVFLGNVYNFMLDEPACVIDVGLNIGFSSLQFARKANVAEVHAFEPFPETYRRAIANLSLNPALSAKIAAYCAGLSDNDWSGEVKIGGSEDSGSRTVVADVGDRPVAVTLADAGRVLEPILARARARGLRTIVKIDCEGSEFAIFRSLERAQLMPLIDAIMVEWHAMFDHLNQMDLIRPLRDAGFLVFDQSPPAGNGFFYGVRLAAPPAGAPVAD